MVYKDLVSLISLRVVQKRNRRPARARMCWPLPECLDDDALEALLFPLPPDVPTD